MTQTSESDDESLKKAVGMLLAAKRILILAHMSPDGDTLGASFALCRALIKRGCAVRVECSDEIPAKYGYLSQNVVFEDFEPLGCEPLGCEPELIVAADIASVNLFGERLAKYAGRVDLCIDHHPSNTQYASYTLLNPRAAATCELMLKVINLLNVEIDRDIADCIYTGLATDTGCFRFSNTTPATLRAAADMVELGARSAYINKLMFETTTRDRLEMERMALETLEYHFGGRAAVITITREMNEKTGVKDCDTEGLPSLPARIEGVLAGVTVKEKCEGVIKISLRTNGGLDASKICAKLGGGGHSAAAGCQFEGSVKDAKKAILESVGAALEAYSTEKK